MARKRLITQRMVERLCELHSEIAATKGAIGESVFFGGDYGRNRKFVESARHRLGIMLLKLERERERLVLGGPTPNV